MPSGMLWSIKTMAEINPSLYRFEADSFFSIFESTIVEIDIPRIINMALIRRAGSFKNDSLINEVASGISEIREIVNIMPLEKAKAAAIV